MRKFCKALYLICCIVKITFVIDHKINASFRKSTKIHLDEGGM
jgi:hypothetical protein